MSLYPSLEDMKADHMAQAQQQVASVAMAQSAWSAPSASAPVVSSLPYPVNADSEAVYPWLAEYMGLELTEDMIRSNMPEYLSPVRPTSHAVATVSSPQATNGANTMVAPLSSNSPAFARSQISHGVRQVVLCKDGDGKVGLRVRSINKGVFVCLVAKNSAAAMGGLRFGDQVLQINGENVAGFSEAKVHDIFKKIGVNNIVLAVRDRPFERTLTLHKDSTGHLGFQFKDGKITAIAVESSAARNGLLIEHNLLEVNGQNVVGVKDKDISNIIEEGGQIVTVTVIPNFLFQHMMKNMANSLVKKMMDHSIPDL